MWCSAVDSHLKRLDRVVRSVDFLSGAVFECTLANRRSVAVLCMLFTIKSNPVHPLSGVLTLPYVPARVTRGALAAIITHLRILAVLLISVSLERS